MLLLRQRQISPFSTTCQFIFCPPPSPSASSSPETLLCAFRSRPQRQRQRRDREDEGGGEGGAKKKSIKQRCSQDEALKTYKRSEKCFSFYSSSPCFVDFSPSPPPPSFNTLSHRRRRHLDSFLLRDGRLLVLPLFLSSLPSLLLCHLFLLRIFNSRGKKKNLFRVCGDTKWEKSE